MLIQPSYRYISGRLILNDLNKQEQERLTACMQQLNQILMTQECHPGVEVVSHSLQVKTLKLYGKCAIKCGDVTKAEQIFVRLCDLCNVRSAILFVFWNYCSYSLAMHRMRALFCRVLSTQPLARYAGKWRGQRPACCWVESWLPRASTQRQVISMGRR